MNNSNDIVISTKNLSKVYKLYKNPKDRLKEALSLSKKIYHKDFYALKNINLEIRRGEVIGIVGKNGSGKSTLLKILSRVLTPTSGDFIAKGKVSSLLELGSGFNPELTGIENIFFYATILGIEDKKIKGKLQEILDFADIGDFVYQPLKTYSSGMKARLAFSVAINVDPDILILDEVLAVGDELFRRKCHARMEGFFKGGKTILFVSHNASDINQLCTRAILLDKGETLIEGATKLVTALYQRYLFAKPENSNAIRKSIIELNHDRAKKELAIENLESNKGKNEKKKTTDEGSNLNGLLAIDNSEKNIQKPYYIPDFIPKSRLEYKYYEVEIFDVKITTISGHNVNVLVIGEKYILSFVARFNITVEGVLFGMQIKNEKGMHLCGINSSYDEPPGRICKAHESYLARFDFTCNLLHGNYYCNSGVAIMKQGKIEYLNRIIDAMVFKVQPNGKDKSGLVYTDLNVKIERQ